MANSFVSVLAELEKAKQEGTTGAEAGNLLRSFGKKVCLGLFSCFAHRADLVAPFRNIWEIFIELAKSPVQGVRIANSRAAGSFIATVAPFRSEQIIVSFVDASCSIKYHSIGSPFIISVFAVLSQYLSPPLVPNYFTFGLISNHFAVEDPNFSEMVPKIVPGMGHLGKQWLKNLLTHMLDNFSDNPNRHVIRTLKVVISFYPDEFMAIAIEKCGSDCQNFLSMFAFLFTSVLYDMDGLDMLPLVHYCFELLSDPEMRVGLVDLALQVLSVHKELVVEYTPDTVVLKDDKHEVRLATDTLCERGAFFGLPLPLDVLKPNDEDSILVLTGKFTTIGNRVGSMTEEEKQEVVRLYESVLTRQYDDRVSAALNSLSTCVNIITIDNRVLRRCVMAPKQSWFHCLDIVRLLEQMDPAKLEDKLALSIIDVVVGFVLDKNEVLSSRAVSLICKLANTERFEDVTYRITCNIKFCDSENTAKLLKLVLALCESFKDTLGNTSRVFSHLKWLVDTMFEIIQYETYDIAFMSDLFEFVAFFPDCANHPMIEKTAEIAYLVIREYYAVLRGRSLGIGVVVDDPAMRNAIHGYITLHTVDLMWDETTTDQLRPLKCAMKFVFILDSKLSLNCEICMKMFQLAPLECSNFIAKHVGESESLILFLTKGGTLLKGVNNIETFAVWCGVLERTCRGASFTDVISYLNVVACHYLHQQKISDMEIGVRFCSFLAQTYDRGSEELVYFNERMVREQKISGETMVCRADAHKFAYKDMGSSIGIDFEQDLRYAFLSESYSLLYSILSANQKAVPLEMLEECPLSLRNDVVKHGLTLPDLGYAAIDALKYVRGPWNRLAIKAIQANATALLDSLAGMDKVSKANIANLCACIDHVSFNGRRVLDLANVLWHKHSSPKKFVFILRLFTCGLMKTEGIQGAYISVFADDLATRVDTLSTRELAFWLRTVSCLKNGPSAIGKLVTMVDAKYADASLVRSNILCARLMCVGRKEVESVLRTPDAVDLYFRFKLPSALLGGSRILRTAAAKAPTAWTNRVMTTSVSRVIKMIDRVKLLPFVSPSLVQMLCVILQRTSNKELVRKMREGLASTLSEDIMIANYVGCLLWVPRVIIVSPTYVSLDKQLSMFQKVSGVDIFDLATDVLDAVLRVTKSEKESLVYDEFIAFMESHRHKQSYYTLQYVLRFGRYFEKLSEAYHVQFLIHVLHSISFLPACLCVAVSIRRRKDANWTRLTVDALVQLIGNETEKKAIEMIGCDASLHEIVEFVILNAKQ